MINNIKNNKGITLIEVLIGTVLFSMLIAAVTGIFVPLLKFQMKISDSSELNTLLDNAANLIISDISRSTEPLSNIDVNDVISISINDTNDVVYTVNADGVLLRNGVLIYSRSYYKNKSITFICIREPSVTETKYILTMSVIDEEGNTMIARDYAVRPLILNQY